MRLHLDIDTSCSALSLKLEGMKEDDYSPLAVELLERAKEFVAHLSEHTPTDDPKCDEFGNVLSFEK